MKIKVGVFFGGESCEHEISCITANQVLHAINADKYDVVPVYIAKDGDMYTGEELFDLANYYDLKALCAKLTKISLAKDGNKVYVKPVKEGFFKKKYDTIDVAFLAVHGTNGEDGTLQGYMEMLKLPYTSSNVLGSAIGQDKAMMKIVFEHENIPMVPWFYVYAHDFENDPEPYIAKADKMGYPLIVKPANLGSSIGIEIAHNHDEFAEKVKSASEYDTKIVIEHMITNLKEANCSVMGSVEDCKAAPIEEVLKGDEILSFENKYLGNGSSKGSKAKMPAKAPTKGTKGSSGMASATRRVPAEIGEAKTKLVQEIAVKAFKVLNAHGCVRIDFMIDQDTDQVYVNEINSIPGSLAFYLWQEAGMSFDQECDFLIENALKRYRQKEKMTFSFDTNILSTFRRK